MWTPFSSLRPRARSVPVDDERAAPSSSSVELDAHGGAERQLERVLTSTPVTERFRLVVLSARRRVAPARRRRHREHGDDGGHDRLHAHGVAALDEVVVFAA